MDPCSCASIKPLLSALIDDALSEDERRLVAAHLRTCAACRERLEQYRAIGEAIRALPEPEPPPELEACFRRRLSTYPSPLPDSSQRDADVWGERSRDSEPHPQA